MSKNNIKDTLNQAAGLGVSTSTVYISPDGKQKKSKNNKISDGNKKTAMTLQEENNRIAEKLSSDVNKALYIDSISDQVLDLEKKKKIQKENAHFAAKKYVYDTYESMDLLDAMSKDTKNSLQDWADNTTHINKISFNLKKNTSLGLKNTMNPFVTSVTKTTTDINSKLNKLQQNQLFKYLQGNITYKDTKKTMTALFGKIGMSGAKYTIAYLSQRIVLTTTSPDRLNKVMKGVGDITRVMSSFATYVQAIQNTVIAIEKAVVSIKNAIVKAAERMVNAIVKAVKNAISNAIGSLVDSIFNGIRDGFTSDEDDSKKKESEDKK